MKVRAEKEILNTESFMNLLAFGYWKNWAVRYQWERKAIKSLIHTVLESQTKTAIAMNFSKTLLPALAGSVQETVRLGGGWGFCLV